MEACAFCATDAMVVFYEAHLMNVVGYVVKILKFFNKLILTRALDVNHSKVIDDVYKKINPKSLIEYSFAQYCCQQSLCKTKKKFILLFPFLFLLQLLMLLLLLVSSVFYKANNSYNVKKSKFLAVIPSKEILPFSLKTGAVVVNRNHMESNFSFADFIFCFKVFSRYMGSPYFVLKSIYVVWLYSKAVKEFDSICLSSEYSFTSSILTYYFNCNQVTSINCMHGEKCYDAMDAFCCFDYFYVWDNHYEQLLGSMKCKAEFIVSGCDMLVLNLDGDEKNNVCYLLQGSETTEELLYIRKTLMTISFDYNLKYFFVKPHPRYPTVDIFTVFSEEEVYAVENLKVLQSSLMVCGKFSTVLFQVYKSRVNNIPLLGVFTKFYKPGDDYILAHKADRYF